MMAQDQNSKKDTSQEIGELHPKERELILYIRNRFRYGDIIIKTRDGLPYLILKVTEYQALDKIKD